MGDFRSRSAFEPCLAQFIFESVHHRRKSISRCDQLFPTKMKTHLFVMCASDVTKTFVCAHMYMYIYIYIYIYVHKLVYIYVCM